MSIPYTSNKYGQRLKDYLQGDCEEECPSGHTDTFHMNEHNLDSGEKKRTLGCFVCQKYYDSNKRPDQPVIVTDKERR